MESRGAPRSSTAWGNCRHCGRREPVIGHLTDSRFRDRQSKISASVVMEMTAKNFPRPQQP